MVYLEDARGDLVPVALYNQIPGGRPAAVRAPHCFHFYRSVRIYSTVHPSSVHPGHSASCHGRVALWRRCGWPTATQCINLREIFIV